MEGGCPRPGPEKVSFSKEARSMVNVHYGGDALTPHILRDILVQYLFHILPARSTSSELTTCYVFKHVGNCVINIIFLTSDRGPRIPQVLLSQTSFLPIHLSKFVWSIILALTLSSYPCKKILV